MIRLNVIAVLSILLCGCIGSCKDTSLCSAIEGQRQIVFKYDGHVRTVEPHAYGIHEDTGNEVLRAYQVNGGGFSDDQPGWRLFLIQKIRDLEVQPTSFDTREGYRPGDSDMSKIFCEH